ncbi:MAG TPA: type IV pilus twitching motility protein PilT [Polyangiaceae bacterium LLY-WYZ-15_(1-7)]|nr:twitching motility protein PilT [Myxococcales bacterium]MAT24117.1 twitching motility protein PilT [Sandaracinus sp.]HJK94378.1 type IV pilus twitching motility protein PilT [Polyangiaceae bacterium LLY-WYZ-15_(1-7)]MBJ72280.1 twitching motility protein PilT [Sandaracinus sp.]HJL03074.1 type IV pilus twitching motility protein PilT [Polyangiaceae bacterium LLY-WYZ-15_(1-7)]
MLRIDFYVQHLMRHNATGVELSSGQPVKFLFPSGPRQSNKPIEHAQVAQLVQEAAPPKALEALRLQGRAEFHHSSSAGMEVQVRLEAPGPGQWKVTVLPAQGGAPARTSLPDAKPAGVGGMGGAKPAAAKPAATGGGKPRPKIQEVPGEPRINYYLRMMKAMGASDLHLCAEAPALVRMDGSIQNLEENAQPLSDDELRVILREIIPEKNKIEFDNTNDTDFAHTIEGVARFRANIFMDRKGIGGVFRQIPFEILSVEQIGLPKKVLDLCWLSKGLVLVTGPTGSGKSTTLATLIDFINQNREDHIITIEDPIEFVHPNKKCLVNQREVGTHTKSFKAALRAALREDPDIVLVGEMRDLETISIAIETAETGHLVFGTLHTTSAPSTVDRIIDQFPPEQQEQIRVMLSESLRGVIAQVLCKKKGGGRVAGYEVLIANSAVANLIREGKTFQLKSVMQTGRRQGMQTMNDHLVQHVKDGLVAPEEAYIKSNDKQLIKQAFQTNGIKLDIVDEH